MNGELKIHDDCRMKGEWGSLREKVKVFDRHVAEGDKEGGFRDRVARMEMQIQVVTGWGKWFFITSFVGGFIGGVIGKASPDFFDWIVKVF